MSVVEHNRLKRCHSTELDGGLRVEIHTGWRHTEGRVRITHRYFCLLTKQTEVSGFVIPVFLRLAVIIEREQIVGLQE